MALFRRATKTLTIAVAALLFAIMPALAESAGEQQERIIERQYEWILYADMEVLDHYMNFKGSTMHPILRFVVSWRRTYPGQRARGELPPPGIKYEELWYHNGKAIGLKRYNDITPGPLQQGAIYFRSFTNDSLCNYDRDVTNCMIRLLMDVYSKRSILAGAIVPIDCFENIATDLAQFNFFLLEEASGGKGENMSLHLLSYPKGKDRYFYYDDTGRR